MQKVKKMLASRKVWIPLAILLASLFGTSAWVISGILDNMKKAAQPEPAVPYTPNYPVLPAKIANDPLIQRGDYLVKAGDCIACHTNTSHKESKPFAGGLAMQTPFGVMHTPNITPDKETGIGSWTDAEFVKAMREGISPRGRFHYYYPAFPFTYFNRMPEKDILAMRAYLNQIPAVHQVNLDNAMVWPFSLRILQLPWRILFFHPKPEDQLSENPATPLELGKYLVEGPGHCGMCHTPSWHLISEDLPLGAPIRKYHLTGAKVQGYLAPNISASNLGNVSNDEIVRVFTENRLIGGGKVVGPMLEVNMDSLRYLPRKDLEAIAIYLKSVKSETPPKASNASGGKGTYENYCAGCHVAGAGGAPRFGDAAAWAPLLKSGVDALYTNAIKGINGMPAKGTCLSCTDIEIKEAVDYMIAPVANAAASSVTLPAPVKKLTLEDGKRIYTDNCAVCHNTGFKNAPKPGDVAGFKKAVDAGFVKTYLDIKTGRNGHPAQGACPTCSNAELIAALKYMLQESAPGKNYSLW